MVSLEGFEKLVIMNFDCNFTFLNCAFEIHE